MSDLFGTWQEQKSDIDASDDGYGPYLYWLLGDEGKYKLLWPEFLQWATEHLACGISFACVNGIIVVPAADAAFKAYVAGRNYHTNKES